MKWTENGGRYLKATVGHLFAYIEEIEAYKTSEHPDYEPASFNWFIAPDDEDKNYRRALASGTAATLKDARLKIEEALRKILAKFIEAIGQER